MLACGASGATTLVHLQSAVLHRHPCAQGPCGAGRPVSDWRCAQREEHEPGPQEPVCPLPHEDGQHRGCPGQEAATQMAGSTWQVGRHLRAGKFLHHRDIFT